jgi:hypothetical protein
LLAFRAARRRLRDGAFPPGDAVRTAPAWRVRVENVGSSEREVRAVDAWLRLPNDVRLFDFGADPE